MSHKINQLSQELKNQVVYHYFTFYCVYVCVCLRVHVCMCKYKYTWLQCGDKRTTLWSGLVFFFHSVSSGTELRS